MRSAPWLLIAMTFATVLTVALVIGLATGEWLVLPAALAIHFLGTALVVAATGRALSQQTKPDPATEARIDEEGVRGEREQPHSGERPEDRPHEANPTL